MRKEIYLCGDVMKYTAHEKNESPLSALQILLLCKLMIILRTRNLIRLGRLMDKITFTKFDAAGTPTETQTELTVDGLLVVSVRPRSFIIHSFNF